MENITKLETKFIEENRKAFAENRSQKTLKARFFYRHTWFFITLLG